MSGEGAAGSAVGSVGLGGSEEVVAGAGAGFDAGSGAGCEGAAAGAGADSVVVADSGAGKDVSCGLCEEMRCIDGLRRHMNAD